MPSPGSLIAFAAAAFILIVVPGPNVLFTVGRSLELGRMGGFLSIVGIMVGGIPLVIGVAVGVGAVIAQSIVLFTILKLAGAAYLIYLGVQAIRHRADAAGTADAAAVHEFALRHVTQGFVVGITNPKSIAFFVAVLPQFVDTNAGAVPTQLLVLGLMVLAIGFVCDCAWVLLSSAARGWFGRSPRRLSAMSATGGALMIGLGGGLALTSVKTAAT